MPRQVDPAERRREIASASLRILARGGSQALTLKSLAEEMGGSITLVTHFVSTREDLFSTVIADLVQTHDEQLAAQEDGGDARDRLRVLLAWMVPLDAADIEMEAGRIALIPRRGDHAAVDNFFDSNERKMRELLRDHLDELVPEERLEPAVSYLRAVTNGLALSAVEHPDRWSADEQLRALEFALAGVGIELSMRHAAS